MTSSRSSPTAHSWTVNRGERLVAQLGTEQHWLERKRACFGNVYADMTSLIADSQEQSNVSLAAFRPAKIKKFVVEDDERAWKRKWLAQLK